MREPLGLVLPQMMALAAPVDVAEAVQTGDWAAALAGMFQEAHRLMQGEQSVPLPQLSAWLDALPDSYRRMPEAMALQAWLLFEQRKPTRALALFDEAAALWAKERSATGRMWMITLRTLQGQIYEQGGRTGQAGKAYAEARAGLAEFANRSPLTVRTLDVAPEEAERLSALDATGLSGLIIDALHIYQDAGDWAGTARMAHALGHFYLDQGEPVGARYWLERALELRRGQRGGLPLAFTLDSLGACYRQLGMLNEAQPVLDEALRLAAHSGHRLLQAHGLANLGDLYRDLDEWGTARGLYQKAMALKEQLQDGVGIATIQLSLSTLYRRQGQYALAADAAREAGAFGHGYVTPGLRDRADLCLTIAGLFLGQDEAAAHLAELADRLEGCKAMAADAALARWYLAWAAYRQGDLVFFRKQFESALTTASRYRRVHLLAMELPATAVIYKPGVEMALCPEALAGLIQRATSRGLASLMEQAPAAAAVVAAAGRLAEATALSVQLLGPFHVLRAGREIDLSVARSQKAISLLKYLVAHRGRVAMREQILEAIWPEVVPEVADRSFEVTVSNLRRLLDPAVGPPLIIRRGRGYMINPDVSVAVDADQFTRHLEQGNWWWQRGQTPLAVAEWEIAESCYQGDFLAEDPYDEWATAERERLREQYLDLLVRLGEVALQAGEFRMAVQRAGRVLEEDPIRETAFRLLMRARAGEGNRAVALRHFRRFARLLVQELGEEPTPETCELARRIHAGEPV